MTRHPTALEVPLIGGDLRPLPELRSESGFAWACRQARVEDGRITEIHQITSSDRDEYDRHMRSHGRRPVNRAYEPWKPWKAPRPVREYKPKPMDAGQPVQWVKVTPAHWEGRNWDDPATSPGQWIEEVRETRTGVIWSVADVESAWWVQPDDNPARPVYVKRAGKSDWPRKAGDLYENPGVAEAARANLLRGEVVRQRGIFPVIDSQNSLRWGTTYVHVVWHSDPDCPRAAGKEPYDPANHPKGDVTGYQPFGRGMRKLGQQRWTPEDIADVLISGEQAPGDLCPTCITGIDVDSPHSPARAELARRNGSTSETHGASPNGMPQVVGELVGATPFQSAICALDGYVTRASAMAEATGVLEAQLTICGLDRDQVLMLHISAISEAAAALRAHAGKARTGFIERHAAGFEYHASGRDAAASGFRTTPMEGTT
jgi:hypothetical protein